VTEGLPILKAFPGFWSTIGCSASDATTIGQFTGDNGRRLTAWLENIISTGTEAGAKGHWLHFFGEVEWREHGTDGSATGIREIWVRFPPPKPEDTEGRRVQIFVGKRRQSDKSTSRNPQPLSAHAVLTGRSIAL